jgi:cation diffusion facilitator CzcD-associated flavoprotein CzcO
VLDTAIVGAGPYGLSLAAHLREPGQSLRVFGSPMRFWSHHMPRGMRLKSEGFASNLYDPDGAFTLGAYCAEQRLAYADIGTPVPVETFVAYGLEFGRRFVPQVEDVEVESLAGDGRSFRITTSAGEHVEARRVVVATGLANF